MTEIGLYDIANSTTPESNKSQMHGTLSTAPLESESEEVLPRNL